MPFPVTLQKIPELANLASRASLPTTISLLSCADLQTTVLDFLPQLSALPQSLLNSLTNRQALQLLYQSTNPAISSVAFSLATFPIFLIVSEINKNYSQVDRVWSILPTLFHAHYAVWAWVNGLPAQRVSDVLAFSLVWSTRLTFNYWRKGGYSIGSEDYRWKIIQGRVGGLAFFALNLGFISSWQILILWAVTAPTYILLLVSRHIPEMTLADSIFSRLLTALIVLAFFADQQMWDYQTAKASYRATARIPAGWTQEQMERGFITTGLWRWSRHPNFAAEQAIWVVLYAWGCYLTGSWFNWSAIGMLQYLAVFQGSTPITEAISAGKYPEYKFYQQRVGRFMPKLWGKRWDEAEMGGEVVKKEK